MADALRAGGAAGPPVEIVSAAAVGGMPPVREDTGTFVGNARKKARALRERLPADGWALADDSGLCVEALGGAPGVDSAYYAGPQGDPGANLAKLAEVMRGVPRGPARRRIRVRPRPRRPRRRRAPLRGQVPGAAGVRAPGRGRVRLRPALRPRRLRADDGRAAAQVKNRISHRGPGLGAMRRLACGAGLNRA